MNAPTQSSLEYKAIAKEHAVSFMKQPQIKPYKNNCNQSKAAVAKK